MEITKDELRQIIQEELSLFRRETLEGIIAAQNVKKTESNAVK